MPSEIPQAGGLSPSRPGPEPLGPCWDFFHLQGFAVILPKTAPSCARSFPIESLAVRNRAGTAQRATTVES